ncbi:MAG: RNA polymerase sigma factor [Ruminococcus sp.]|nr:RNA polymerase sigma factor [Ruminococcus sp.]
MNENEWRQLTEQAAGGDKAAFGRLYELSGRKVYFTCLKLLGNEQDARDVMQESYLIALTNLTTLKEYARFESWVCGIAVNKCRQRFQKGADASLDEQLEQGLDIPDSGLIPEDYVTDGAKRKIIMDIIDRELTPEQRQTVILFYYNGYTVADIARIMECPDGTVKYRLSAARAKIKEAVLIYEEKNDDRLHAIVPLPALTRIFRQEAGQTALPPISLDLAAAAGPANNAALKTGGSKMTKALIAKIAAGAVAVIAAVVIVIVAVNAGSDKDDGNSKKTKKDKSSSEASSVIEDDSKEEDSKQDSPAAPAETEKPADQPEDSAAEPAPEAKLPEYRMAEIWYNNELGYQGQRTAAYIIEFLEPGVHYGVQYHDDHLLNLKSTGEPVEGYGVIAKVYSSGMFAVPLDSDYAKEMKYYDFDWTKERNAMIVTLHSKTDELPPSEDLLLRANMEVYDADGNKTVLEDQEFTVNATADEITNPKSGLAHGNAIFKLGDHWFMRDIKSVSDWLYIEKLDSDSNDFEDSDDYTYLFDYFKPFVYDEATQEYLPAEEATGREIAVAMKKTVIDDMPAVRVIMYFKDDETDDENARKLFLGVVDGDDVLILQRPIEGLN